MKRLLCLFRGHRVHIELEIANNRVIWDAECLCCGCKIDTTLSMVRTQKTTLTEEQIADGCVFLPTFEIKN